MPEKPQKPKRIKSAPGHAPGKRRPKLKRRKKLTPQERENSAVVNSFLMGGMLAVVSRFLMRNTNFGKVPIGGLYPPLTPIGGPYPALPKASTKTPAKKPRKGHSK